MKKVFSNNVAILIIISILFITGYFFTLYFLNEKNMKANEYGDYIGGVLNPFLTLLSSLAIICLTIIISRSESLKSDESLKTQKRLTLNQMRNEASNNLMNKLNLYVYELDSIHVTNDTQSKFYQKVILNELKAKRKGKDIHPNIWLIMLLELESFSQKVYLFDKLFSSKEHDEVYSKLCSNLQILVDEHISEESVKSKSLSNFISSQEAYSQIIGEFILNEF